MTVMAPETAAMTSSTDVGRAIGYGNKYAYLGPGQTIAGGPLREPVPSDATASRNPGTSFALRFGELASRWHRETGGISAPARVTSNDAYLRIIALGERVVPLILRDLRDQGGFWYPALRAITGQWPVPAHAVGKPRLMKEAWFRWARERGIAF